MKNYSKRSVLIDSLKLTPNLGYIYVMMNPSLQTNFLKIGRTTRKPEDRARELSSSSGLPAPYSVAIKRLSYDCISTEDHIHKELQQYRVTNLRVDRDREFFALPLSQAIETLQNVVDELNKNFYNHFEKRRENKLLKIDIKITKIENSSNVKTKKKMELLKSLHDEIHAYNCIGPVPGKYRTAEELSESELKFELFSRWAYEDMKRQYFTELDISRGLIKP